MVGAGRSRGHRPPRAGGERGVDEDDSGGNPAADQAADHLPESDQLIPGERLLLRGGQPGVHVGAGEQAAPHTSCSRTEGAARSVQIRPVTDQSGEGALGQTGLVADEPRRPVVDGEDGEEEVVRTGMGANEEEHGAERGHPLLSGALERGEDVVSAFDREQGRDQDLGTLVGRELGQIAPAHDGRRRRSRGARLRGEEASSAASSAASTRTRSRQMDISESVAATSAASR